MNDAVAVALEGIAVRMLGFGVAASEAARDGKTQTLEHEYRAIVPAVRRLR